MGALKTLGIICVVFAFILALITSFFILSYLIKIIAVIAAVAGSLWIIGALIWLAVCEAFGKN